MCRATLRLAVILLAIPFSLLGQEQNDAADAARLIDVLRLREGSTVADIGAGTGDLTVRMARHVGPKGTVYSTDINPERLQDIRKAVTTAGVENVQIVEGGSARTNLPRECCDAVVMRHVQQLPWSSPGYFLVAGRRAD